MSVIRPILACATRVAWPTARVWARRGFWRSLPPAEPPRRLAVVACHWIGDTFWASQVVPALAARWPACQILAVTKPRCRDLWNGVLPPENVILAPEVVSDRRREEVDWWGIRRRAAELRQRRIDVVIDLTGNRYSAVFSYLLRPRWLLGFGGGELGWLYSRRVSTAERPGEHLSRRPFRVIEPLVGETPPEAPRPPRATHSFAEMCAALRLDVHLPVAVLAPGAGWPEKEWPATCFTELAARLGQAGWQVAVVGSAAQESLCRAVASAGSAASSLSASAVMAGRPLGEVVGLLSGAAAVVGNDSGIVHLSAAMGRKTVAVFSGATEERRCGPLGVDATVLDGSQAKVTADDVARLCRSALARSASDG
jgi:heptosyltransferase-2